MHLYAAAIALANDDGNVLNLVTNQMNEQNKGEQQKTVQSTNKNRDIRLIEIRNEHTNQNVKHGGNSIGYAALEMKYALK